MTSDTKKLSERLRQQYQSDGMVLHEYIEAAAALEADLREQRALGQSLFDDLADCKDKWEQAVSDLARVTAARDKAIADRGPFAESYAAPIARERDDWQRAYETIRQDLKRVEKERDAAKELRVQLLDAALLAERTARREALQEALEACVKHGDVHGRSIIQALLDAEASNE